MLSAWIIFDYCVYCCTLLCVLCAHNSLAYSFIHHTHRSDCFLFFFFTLCICSVHYDILTEKIVWNIISNTLQIYIYFFSICFLSSFVIFVFVVSFSFFVIAYFSFRLLCLPMPYFENFISSDTYILLFYSGILKKKSILNAKFLYM